MRRQNAARPAPAPQAFAALAPREWSGALTQADFHVRVPDRRAYALRWLARAQREPAAVFVVGPLDDLRALSDALWSRQPTSFVAHALVSPGYAPPARVRARTRLLLGPVLDEAPPEAIVLNLGFDRPEGWQRHARVVELVAADELDLQRGRALWRAYQADGCSLRRHELEGATASGELPPRSPP